MSKDKFKLNTIESAINDIRKGKIVIVVDDKNKLKDYEVKLQKIGLNIFN